MFCRRIALKLLFLLPLVAASHFAQPECGLEYLEDTNVEGRWVPRTPPDNFDGLTWQQLEQMHGYHCPGFHHLCGRRSDAELARAKALSMWEWEPSTCSLPAFDGDQFYARFMKSNVTLMMVGDSITQEHYVSLTCQLSKNIVRRADSTHPI